MGLLDLLQQGYQGYKQSDVPVAALLRNEPENFFPSVERNLEQQLSLLQTPEGALDLVNPISKAGGLLGSINLGKKSFPQFSDEFLENFKNKNRLPVEKKIGNKPMPSELVPFFDDYRKGNISQSDYIKQTMKFFPPQTFTNVPKLTPLDNIGQALNKKQTDKGKAILGRGAFIDEGTKVESRLDIPAYNEFGIWSASIRGKTPENMTKTVYGQTAHLVSKGKEKIKFLGSGTKSLKVAEGGNKSPFAVMEGYYKATSPEKSTQLAKKYMNNSEWSQIGMNPRRAGYFYDKADGMPVSEADEVIQIGPLVLGKNVKKFNPKDSLTNRTNPKTGGLLSF